MMKKKNLVISMTALFVLIGGWAVYDNTHQKTDYQFDDFCKLSSEAASRAEIWDGGTGKITVITNPETVDTLVKSMEDSTYKKVKRDSYTDWNYSVALYAGDTEITKVELRGEDSCRIDGGDYKSQTSMVEEVKQLTQESAK